jgi:hypothetical protein
VAKLSVSEWGNLGDDTPGELVDGLLEAEEVPTALHDLLAACS